MRLQRFCCHFVMACHRPNCEWNKLSCMSITYYVIILTDVVNVALNYIAVLAIFCTNLAIVYDCVCVDASLHYFSAPTVFTLYIVVICLLCHLQLYKISMFIRDNLLEHLSCITYYRVSNFCIIRIIQFGEVDFTLKLWMSRFMQLYTIKYQN